jgi:CheY-like chemotaxis protein
VTAGAPRVLLVDDEEAIREGLASFLTRSGMAVETAADGEAALAAHARWRPDILVCDVLMPRLDGRSVVRRLRAAGDWDQADSIVVVSGPLPVDEINKCLGIRGYCRRMFQRLSSLPHGKLQAHAHAGRHQGYQGYQDQQRRAA